VSGIDMAVVTRLFLSLEQVASAPAVPMTFRIESLLQKVGELPSGVASTRVLVLDEQQYLSIVKPALDAAGIVPN